MSERLVPCRFRVPTHYNDGTEVPPKIMAEIDTALAARFGGYSVLGIFEGCWGSQVETCKAYEVSVPADKVPEVRSCVVGIGWILKQECMYLDIGQPSVELVDTSAR